MVLKVEDPLGLAAEAKHLAVGTDRTELQKWALKGKPLPRSLTLTRPKKGEVSLWCEALDAAGMVGD